MSGDGCQGTLGMGGAATLHCTSLHFVTGRLFVPIFTMMSSVSFYLSGQCTKMSVLAKFDPMGGCDKGHDLRRDLIQGHEKQCW